MRTESLNAFWIQEIFDNDFLRPFMDLNGRLRMSLIEKHFSILGSISTIDLSKSGPDFFGNSLECTYLSTEPFLNIFI